MNCKITVENLPKQRIFYMRRTGAYGAENYALMEKFKSWVRSRKLYGATAVIYAIAQDNPEVTPPECCRYDVCLAVSDDAEANNEAETGVLGGGKYAVFEFEHTAAAVAEAWASCFPEAEKLGYTPDFSRPVIERYAKKKLNENLCELCLPIL